MEEPWRTPNELQTFFIREALLNAGAQRLGGPQAPLVHFHSFRMRTRTSRSEEGPAASRVKLATRSCWAAFRNTSCDEIYCEVRHTHTLAVCYVDKLGQGSGSHRLTILSSLTIQVMNSHVCDANIPSSHTNYVMDPQSTYISIGFIGWKYDIPATLPSPFS